MDEEPIGEWCISSSAVSIENSGEIRVAGSPTGWTRIPSPALRLRNRRCSREVTEGGDDYPRWWHRDELRREQRYSDKDGPDEEKLPELPHYLHCTPGCRVESPGLKKSAVIVPQIGLKPHWTDKYPIAEG